MKKNGLKNASDSAKQNTTTKMLTIPFWAYCVQMRTTSFEAATDAVEASSFMFSLM